MHWDSNGSLLNLNSVVLLRWRRGSVQMDCNTYELCKAITRAALCCKPAGDTTLRSVHVHNHAQLILSEKNQVDCRIPFQQQC